MPPPYDAFNFLRLLGIEIVGEGEDTTARLTVRHDLIAGTGYLWAPVVITLADALCAFGVSRHRPEGMTSFTTVEAKTNFLASAREGEVVVGHATPPRLDHAGLGCRRPQRDGEPDDGRLPLHPAPALPSAGVNRGLTAGRRQPRIDE